MATRTLLSLRDRAKKRANLENSDFVTDTEWNEYLNYSISELRDIITSKAGDDYFASSQDISLLNNSETYPLPDDFYKILWVEILSEDGYYYKMKRFEVSEKNNYIIFNSFVPDIRYRLRGDELIFAPLSAIGGRSARLWYVPLLTELSSDSDSLIGFNGWDEYPVLRSAIMALEKEEQDTSSLSMRLDQLRLRVEAMAENRDQGQPMRIQDNNSASAVYPWH